jgi:hypothetical protein
MMSIYGKLWRGSKGSSSMLNSRSASFGWILSFLRHVISKEGVAVDSENVKAMVEWTRPISVFEI